MKDYYKILEVKHNADKNEIKKAFRTLAKKYHPDRNRGNDEALRMFQEINEAYETLGNEDNRKKYDEKLQAAGEKKSNSREKASKSNKSSSTKRTDGKSRGTTKADFENLNSYFENFFGFDPHSSQVNQDKLKKDKNPLDVSDMFNQFFKVKKK